MGAEPTEAASASTLEAFPAPPTALILAAGKATRMGTLCDRIPKAMLPVGGLPLLHWMVSWLCRHGLPVVIGVGHLSEVIEAYFSQSLWRGKDVRLARQPAALGTGGLIRFAEAAASNEQLLVLNGDTIVSFGIEQLMRFHTSQRVPITQVLSRTSPQNQGAIVVDSSGRVLRFEEGWSVTTRAGMAGGAGEPEEARLSSTGCYVFERQFVRREFPAEPCDLTQELLPAFVERGLVWGHSEIVPGLWDIGDPARYLEVKEDASLLQLVYGSPL